MHELITPLIIILTSIIIMILILTQVEQVVNHTFENTMKSGHVVNVHKIYGGCVSPHTYDSCLVRKGGVPASAVTSTLRLLSAAQRVILYIRCCTYDRKHKPSIPHYPVTVNSLSHTTTPFLCIIGLSSLTSNQFGAMGTDRDGQWNGEMTTCHYETDGEGVMESRSATYNLS